MTEENIVVLPIIKPPLVRSFSINGKQLAGYTWVEPKTIDDAWEIIKKERELRQLQGGFKVGTKWYQSDYNSRIKYLGLLAYGINLPNTIQWKTFDNSFQLLNPTLVTQIFQGVATMDALVFSTAEQIRSKLTLQGLASFDPTVGWPQVYWEV